MTNENTPSVADIIYAQIGRKAFVMMGTKQAVADKSALQFTVGRNAKGVTMIRVELDPSDTYTVRFFKGSPTKARYDAKAGEFKNVGGYKEIESLSDVYVDSLHRVIESGTGLYLSL